MTSMDIAAELGPRRPKRVLSSLYRDEPLIMTTATVLALLIIPLAAAGQMDPRMHLDVNIWVKPVKFLIALSIYCATLAFFARWLTPEFRASRLYRWWMIAAVVAMAGEMAWIGGAAALGAGSHFNMATPLMAALYPIMGALATLLTSATAVYAVGIARNRASGLSPVVKESLVAGLALTLPLTLITAGTLASMSGHAVGGTGSDAGGLWIMGWLRDAGDLRVPHFFATHAMHALPLFGLAAMMVATKRRTYMARTLCLLYVGFVFWTMSEALAGRPFLPGLG